MNTWTIAYYTILRNFRDLKTILALTIFPIVLILIVGTALDSRFTPQTMKITKVGYLSENTGSVSKQFGQFLQSDKVKELLEVQEIKSFDDGMSQVKSEEIETFIYIPGEKSTIQVYGNQKLSAVQPLIESFIRAGNTVEAIAKLGVSYTPQEISSSTEEIRIATKGKIPRGIDYYAVTTLFQCLLIGAALGILSLTRDAANHTNLRMNSFAVKSYEILIGKILGNSLTLFSTAAFVVLFTKYVVHANWNGNMAFIFLVLFLFSIISISLGTLLVKLTNSTVISVLIMVGFSTIFTLASGGFIRTVDPVLEQIGWFTPSYYAQQAIFTSIYGGGSSTIETSILCLFLYTGLIMILTLAADRRRLR